LPVRAVAAAEQQTGTAVGRRRSRDARPGSAVV